ncbi:MAG: hypothetical protein KDE26_18615 [Bacteroidetes bacterium]|nr:hypothetical protein [Bacteroidota bacterium]MCB0845273.1 hypothetical protein [Bacteroidota bacterium]
MKLNKVITLLFTFGLAVLLVAPVQAQYTMKEKEVSPKKMEKLTKKDKKKLVKFIKEKPVKEARKESKKLRKEGYLVFPGSAPMDKQLERIWMKQYQENPDGTQKYLISDGNGVGKTQTAAEMQAMEAAKLQLAGQISNEVNQIIEGKIANDQIDRETGNSLTKFVAGSKNYIVQNLMYVNPGFKIYRNVGSKDMEVAVKMFYNAEEAMIAAERALEQKIRNELESEADELIEEINRLFKK